MQPDTKWMLVVDERHASLFACQPRLERHWHAEQRNSLENHWENYHEHHRPNLLGRGPSPNAAQHFASTDRDPDEEHRRFARDVVKWLGEQLRTMGIGHIEIVAAPRFLGLLRPRLGPLGKRASLHNAELAKLRAPALAAHPVVRAALAVTHSLSSSR